MSKNFSVLEKAASKAAFPEPASGREAEPRSEDHRYQPAGYKHKPVGYKEKPGRYAGLIRRLFQEPTAVAVIAAAPSEGLSDICEGIAGELAGSGKQVLVVPVDKLLRMNPLPVPDAACFTPGAVPGVWVWPSTVGRQIEFFKSRMRVDVGNWLDSLRRNFDCVLLDCTAVDVVPGGAEVAAMADAAVLAVEAGQTPKHQIKSVQHALQLRGARLTGTILIPKNK